MSGIFSRLSRGPKPLTLAEKHRMMLDAVELFEADRPRAEVEAGLQAQGASAEEAATVAEQAQGKFEDQLLRHTTLPDSANNAINYYFLLGVTPDASVERIRRAYRRKAKDVHPDRHDAEFTREFWAGLMTLIGEAHEVLTDPARRRAYDIIWRERSRKVAADNQRQGDLRGDRESRYRWEMAELSQLEDDIADLLDRITAELGGGGPTVEAVSGLAAALENYEADILELRGETHSLPASFLRLGETVRNEMHRKERLVSALQELVNWLPQAARTEPPEGVTKRITAVEQVMLEVRSFQNQFDISGLR